jgi:hypothetical protein
MTCRYRLRKPERFSGVGHAFSVTLSQRHTQVFIQVSKTGELGLLKRPDFESIRKRGEFNLRRRVL